MLRDTLRLALITSITLVLPASVATADDAKELLDKVFAAWKIREEAAPRFKVTWDAEYTQSLKSVLIHREYDDAPRPTSGRTIPMKNFSLSMDVEKIALHYYLVGQHGGTNSRLINLGTVQTEFIKRPHEATGSANVYGSVEFDFPLQWMLSPVFLLYRPSLCFAKHDPPYELTAVLQSEPSPSGGNITLIQTHEYAVWRFFLGPAPDFVVERIEIDRVQAGDSVAGADSPPPKLNRGTDLDVEYMPAAEGALPQIAGWNVTVWENLEKRDVEETFSARVTSTAMVDTFPASEFDPYDFPVGTRVVEAKTGNGLWMQGENGKRETYVPYQPPKTARTPPPEFKESLRPPTTFYDYGFYACLLVFVLALVAWWWRR